MKINRLYTFCFFLTVLLATIGRSAVAATNIALIQVQAFNQAGGMENKVPEKTSLIGRVAQLDLIDYSVLGVCILLLVWNIILLTRVNKYKRENRGLKNYQLFPDKPKVGRAISSEPESNAGQHWGLKERNEMEARIQELTEERDKAIERIKELSQERQEPQKEQEPSETKLVEAQTEYVASCLTGGGFKDLVSTSKKNRTTPYIIVKKDHKYTFRLDNDNPAALINAVQHRGSYMEGFCESVNNYFPGAKSMEQVATSVGKLEERDGKFTVTERIQIRYI